MPRPHVFLDTSFIIALENTRDTYHDLAKRLDRTLLRRKAILHLHPGVVLEIGDGFARLERRRIGTGLLRRIAEEDRYQLSPITDSLLREAEQLYVAREDKEWGLTDCISFVLMWQEGIEQALTADVHFRQAGFKALLLESP